MREQFIFFYRVNGFDLFTIVPFYFYLLNHCNKSISKIQYCNMATTGLASSSTGKFDSVAPPKASSLPEDLVRQLLVNLDDQIKRLKNDKEFDLEGLLAYQRTANYL